MYAAEDSDTAFLTDQFLSWLSEQSSGWSSMLCYCRPHPPFTAPAPYKLTVDSNSLPPMKGARTWQEQAAIQPYMAVQMNNGLAHETFYSLTGLARDISLTHWMSVRATYCGLMIEVDHHLGWITQVVKQFGQYGNTQIIFTSDRGDPVGDYWLGNQLSYHDIQAHLPLIIRDPAEGACKLDGTKVSRFTEANDILPTLLDWLGQDIPTEIDGMSLLLFLHGKVPENWRQLVHWEYNFPSPPEPLFSQGLGISEDECMMSVIRDDHFKHVFFPALEPLLFGLKNDPDEMVNLARDPGYARIEREYLAEQLRLRILHADRRTVTTLVTAQGVLRRRDVRRLLRPVLYEA